MKIVIPTKLSEITTEQYLKGLEVIDKQIELICIFCNLTANEVLSISPVELNEIYKLCLSLFDITEVELQMQIDINKVKYGFIPDLENITTAEYLDLEAYIDSNPLRFLAVIYRPIKRQKGELYTIRKYKGTSDWELFKKVPASVYVGCKVFFYNLNKELLRNIAIYLTQEERRILEQNGIGTQALTRLQMEIDSLLKKSLN